MNGQLLTRIENLEKELKEIKAQLKDGVKEQGKTQAKKKPALTLTELAKKLQVIGKEISPKELEEEIEAVRAQK